MIERLSTLVVAISLLICFILGRSVQPKEGFDAIGKLNCTTNHESYARDVEGNGKNDAAITLKIYKGSPAPQHRFSYVVALEDEYGSKRCTGLLVHSQYVLTAAHCVDNDAFPLGSRPFIYISSNGTKIKHPDGLKVQAVDVLLHPGYKKSRRCGCDVALVKLSDAINGIALPKLSSRPLESSESELFALGFGALTSADNPELAEELQLSTTLMQIKNSTDSSDCACPILHLRAPEHSGSPCKGDSGGPVLIPHLGPNEKYKDGNPTEDSIVGLTFSGDICNKTDSEGFYVSIPAVKDWITKQTQGSVPSCFSFMCPAAAFLSGWVAATLFFGVLLHYQQAGMRTYHPSVERSPGPTSPIPPTTPNRPDLGSVSAPGLLQILVPTMPTSPTTRLYQRAYLGLWRASSPPCF